MPKFLYLQLQEYADTWIHGGRIPIMPARTYLDISRQGTKTPDEIMQKRIEGASLRELAGVRFAAERPVRNTKFVNCTFHGKHIPGTVQYDQYPEEALVLCMCNVRDDETMRGLGKVVGVQIDDVHALKELLDERLGFVSKCGDVSYTGEPGNRSHFLKGTEDSWQQEYRLVWVGVGIGDKPLWVELPSGFARPIQ